MPKVSLQKNSKSKRSNPINVRTRYYNIAKQYINHYPTENPPTRWIFYKKVFFFNFITTENLIKIQ